MVKTNGATSPLFSLKLSIIIIITYLTFYGMYPFSTSNGLNLQSTAQPQGTATFQSPAGDQYSARQFSSREFF